MDSATSIIVTLGWGIVPTNRHEALKEAITAYLESF
jgi:hypothetical protein